MTEVTSLDIRRAAMGLLARRDYSRQELRDRLLQKFSRQINNQRLPFGRVPIDRVPTVNASGSPSSSLQAAAIAPDEARALIDTVSATEELAETPLDLEALILSELDQLQRENLQSDERFVESFINGRKSRGDGPYKIRQALRFKGVSDGLVERLLDEGSEEWLALAERVYRKKFGSDKPANARDYKEKARRQRFMQQRGFPGWMLDALL